MAGISEHPDVIRAREAADAVRAAGGSAMDAALAAIAAGFDEVAAARSRAERKARIRQLQEQQS